MNQDLVKALVDKGGYSQIAAENEASGPRAAELVREFKVGTNQSGIGASSPTIDINSLYSNELNSAGVTEKQKQLDKLQSDLNTSIAQESDNPFISQSTLTGRIGKLRDKIGAQIDTLSNQISTSKSDAMNKVNLQLRQIDVNNTQTQQAMTNLNNYLSSGLLDNATTNDVVTLANQTGIPTSMIQNAISTRKTSNQNIQIKAVEDPNTGSIKFLTYGIDPVTGQPIVLGQQSVNGIVPVTKPVNLFPSTTNGSAWVVDNANVADGTSSGLNSDQNGSQLDISSLW